MTGLAQRAQTTLLLAVALTVLQWSETAVRASERAVGGPALLIMLGAALGTVALLVRAMGRPPHLVPSLRPWVAWTAFVWVLAMLPTWHRGGALQLFDGTRVVLEVRPHPEALDVAAWTLVVLPLSFVPALLADPRIGALRAFSMSLVRTSRASAWELLTGPALIMAAAAVAEQAWSERRFFTTIDGDWLVALATSLGGAALVVVGVGRVSDLASGGTAWHRRETAVAWTVLVGPGLLAALAILVWTFGALAGGGAQVIERTVLRLLQVGLAVTLILAGGAAWLAVRHRRRERALALCPRTPVFFDANDLVVDGERTYLRDGAVVALADGTTIPAAGLRLVGRDAVPENETSIEAWVDAAPPATQTYRDRPPTLPHDATVHVGRAYGAREARMLDAIDWAAPAVVLMADIIVVWTALALAAHPRALLLLAWVLRL